MQTNELSASVYTAFDSYTTGYSRYLKWLFDVAWKRELGAGAGYAVVGISQVAGLDLVAGADAIISQADLFDYYDETSRVISFTYDRVLQEPLGGMAMAIADAVLDNTDGRFTPNKNGTIGTAIVPNRPMRMRMGFQLPVFGETLLYLFKGLSFQPRESKSDSTLSISGYDYLESLNQFPLESTIYVDQRTDQIIEDILIEAGLDTFEYVLDEGLNTIGFAWFQKGDTAGERIKKICEAEEATFYQDENGILRFENRQHYSQPPHNASVWDIETDDIISWEQDQSTEIINRAIVTAKPRALRSTSLEIWRAGAEESVPAGTTKEVWADLVDPTYSIETLTAQTDYIAYSATGGGGSEVTDDISIVATLFTTSVKLEITNASAGTAYFNHLRLRGRPALITSEIKIVSEEATSISKYGTKQIEINNDFIDDPDFAQYMAEAIVTKYSEPTARIIVRIQGVPQLQLRDRVRVKDIDLGTYSEYRIMRIQGELGDGLFTQLLTLRKITASEDDA